MSFIAGIVGSVGRLPDDLRGRFSRCIQAMPLHPAMDRHTIEGPSSVLFQAGYPGLWRGPKLYPSREGWSIAATGAVNLFSATPPAVDTSERLWHWVSAGASGDTLPKDLLHFSAACIPPSGNGARLINDPLGTATVAYYVGQDYIAFSSRPSFLGLLCDGLTPNDEAIFEFFLVGHLFGNKTFFREISILPPGGLLEYSDGTARVRRYAGFESVALDTGMSIEEAVDGIFQHLVSMISPEATDEVYADCFLSGGWDSRLLVGLLSNARRVNRTWSTETIGLFSSERAIAAQAARYLGLENSAIPPRFFSVIQDFYQHSRLVDFSSDTGPWIMSLIDALPAGHIYVDGFLVDVLLRPDRHVPPVLAESVRTGDVERATDYLVDMYLELGGPFAYIKAGGRPWRKLLTQDFYQEQARRLRETIAKELEGVQLGQDFATSFVIKNRQRRGIAPLPILLMGSKGPVFLPFCNLELAQLCLRIPLEHKTSGQLQFMLLERVKNGLGQLLSTNSDKKHLRPYLRRWTPMDFTRRLLFGGWLYGQAVTHLGSDILDLLDGGGVVGRLRLVRFPFQLQRLLLVQQALELSAGKVESPLETVRPESGRGVARVVRAA